MSVKFFCWDFGNFFQKNNLRKGMKSPKNSPFRSLFRNAEKNQKKFKLFFQNPLSSTKK